MEKKFCGQCGQELKTETNFCKNCGAKVEKETKEVKPVTPSAPSNNGNIFGILALCLTFGTYILYGIIYWIMYAVNYDSTLSKGLGYLTSAMMTFPLAGIVFMIIGRVKYPSNKFLKVVMWIIIISEIVTVVAAAIIVITCFVTCATTDLSGCS